jgi:hypothetical protein
MTPWQLPFLLPLMETATCRTSGVQQVRKCFGNRKKFVKKSPLDMGHSWAAALVAQSSDDVDEQRKYSELSAAQNERDGLAKLGSLLLQYGDAVERERGKLLLHRAADLGDIIVFFFFFFLLFVLTR